MRWWRSCGLALILGACASAARQRPPPVPPPPAPPSPPAAVDGRNLIQTGMGEARRLQNIRQLTLDGRRNVESSFAPDGKHLMFHSIRGENAHHQVFTMDLDGREVRLVSPGVGLALCAAFAPDRPRILFASSHATPAVDAGVPAPLDAALDVFESDVDGQNLSALAAAPGYDGEAQYSPDGKRVVFTSARDGDLELYVQELDGSGIRRLTHSPGPDGGGMFSPNGARIIFRSYRAGDGTSDLWIINTDGSGERRLTNLHALAWDPVFHPQGNHVVFASNHLPSSETPGQNFDLFLLSLEDAVLERVTYDAGHDTLPSFSRDGKLITWTSSRQGGINQIFTAQWSDG